MKKIKFYILLICLLFLGISFTGKAVYAATKIGTENNTIPKENANNSIFATNNGNIEDDANLVYLIDQFYNNAWNKMIIVITALISFVGVGLPIFFEYIRNKKNNSDIQQFKDAKNQYIESVSNINKRFDEIVKEVDSKLFYSLKSVSDEKNSVMEAYSEIIEQNKELQLQNEVLTKSFENLKNENTKLYNDLKFKNFELMKEILQELSETVADENSKIYITDKIVEIEKEMEDDNVDEKFSISTLCIKIDGVIIKGNTVKDFYRQIIDYLISKNIDIDKEIPYATGKVRYLINFKNEHINGSKFTAPIKVDKYFIETHKSKMGAYNDIFRFLKNFNLLSIDEIAK
jgi:gas vesicle protein